MSYLFNRRNNAFILFLLAFCCQVHVASASPVATAVITASRGDLQVRRSAGAVVVRLEVGGELFDGDQVRTGPNGAASLVFSDGTELRLAPNTTILVTPPKKHESQQGFIALLFGEVWSRLRPGRTIETTYANLTVRGTEVDVRVDAGVTTLTVLEGEVQFYNGQGAVLVDPGEQSLARAGQAPTKPVTIANPGLITEWTLDLNRAFLPRDIYFTTADPTQAAALAATYQASGSANPLALGDALFDSHQPAAALAAYKRAAPGTAVPGTTLERRIAEAELQLGQLDEAQATLQTGITAPGASVTARVADWNGLAWLESQRAHPIAALADARQSLTLDPQNAEAYLLAGIANLCSGNETDARPELVRAGSLPPMFIPGGPTQPATGLPSVTPQALSWLALLDVTDGNLSQAGIRAHSAVIFAPNSALSHASLSLVDFYSGQEGPALHEARVAAQIDPNSVATRLALAQADLADNRGEDAARSAAVAVALDPDLPEGHYILGLADAARRDYPHSERSLNHALALDPNYTAAEVALAADYTKAGDPKRSLSALGDWDKAHAVTPAVQAAQGEALYREGHYTEALADLQTAAKADPDNPLTWGNLARLALDANQLNLAIRAGQRAVALAPDVSEFHSNLGLAYEYSRLDSQAAREFRTAVAIDPQNAAALVWLGQYNVDPSVLLSQRVPAETFGQAFLLDPEVSHELERGGTHGDVEPVLGGEHGIGGNGYVSNSDGTLNAYGEIYDVNTDHPRANSDDHLETGRLDLTANNAGLDHFYLHVARQWNRYGLPGTETFPDTTDSDDFKLTEGIAAVRHQVGDIGYLWASVYSTHQNNLDLNPNDNWTFADPTGPATIPDLSQGTLNRAWVPEVRFDVNNRGAVDGKGLFTLGFSRPLLHSQQYNNLLTPALPPFFPNSVPGYLDQTLDYHDNIAYMQYTGEIAQGLKLSAELRREQLDTDFDEQGVPIAPFVSINNAGSTLQARVLPSLAMNYSAGKTSTIRLLASRQLTDPASTLLAPVDTQITTEPSVLPNAVPEVSNSSVLGNAELDFEHYGKSGDFYKLFAFHNTGSDLVYDFSEYDNVAVVPRGYQPIGNSLLFNDLRRTGLGARYERSLGRDWFTSTEASYAKSHTDSTLYNASIPATQPAVYSGEDAPYQPNVTAVNTLNYVGIHGTKIDFVTNYIGGYYADTDDVNATSRNRVVPRFVFNLALQREPTVRNEYYVQVYNLFGTNQLIYQGIPVDTRQVVVGWIHRF